MDRVRVVWSGFPGGPGVSTFYAVSGAAILGPLRSFFVGEAAGLPSDVTIQVENTGDTLDPATGRLTGAWAGDPQVAVSGTTNGPYAAPVGMMIRWTTGAIADGHRIKGRTFMVPQQGSNFGTNGQPVAGAIAGLNADASSFLLAVAPGLLVWHRPFKGSLATATRPARPAHAGAVFPVTGSSASTKAVVLRSRRD